MILYQLKCPADHRFEAWFRDGAAYDAQAAAGLLICPLCGDTRIGKAPMAPRIARSRGVEREAPAVPAAPAVADTPPVPSPASPPAVSEKVAALQREVLLHLAQVRRTVEENCDYVGDRFADEARKIHYGEADPRGIYGEASPHDVEELQEEGVTFHRIPWLPRTNS